MALACVRQIPQVKGLKDQEITVGRHVFIECTGDWDRAFKFESASIKSDEQNKLKVKVIKAEARSATIFDVDLVFYSAGEFKFPDMILTDGVIELSLGEQNLTVQTVVKPTEDGKPPEPFGPVVPMPLAWPMAYTLIGVTVLVLMVGLAVYSLRRRYRYRQLIAKLKDYESSMDPDLQFYKAIRKSEPTGMPLKDLNQAFRMYVLRRFQIPMFDLKPASVIRFFKKTHPWLKKERLELKKILEDFAVAKDAGDDKKLLLQKIYHFVDRAEELLKKGSL
ncbi:MAG: hypothetical protein A2622_09760 [Bdellovibrionales bacterium RIFCSPHIGHO2_01_FULL_40_29]|nr:MAG: hypothetical protein A2622_09760 [Bdellovibrionales bacterium RIFCSPHIGHO2_01_FULL_40_29]OFZ32466.1 MAG: hypothetical protein A3D17_12905 [Bdellovibrionales bacterium RIFCSPHIGHO2_02_FULL_40_15]